MTTEKKILESFNRKFPHRKKKMSDFQCSCGQITKGGYYYDSYQPKVKAFILKALKSQEEAMLEKVIKIIGKNEDIELQDLDITTHDFLLNKVHRQARNELRQEIIDKLKSQQQEGEEK